MGYNTNFTGQLNFPEDMTIPMLTLVKSFLGNDCRDNPEWGRTDLTYIDLELTSDLLGLQWNGAEKTYDLVDKVNLIIDNVREFYPGFRLSGSLNAQGEEFEDRWILEFDNDGRAVSRPLVTTGTIITCPHCEEQFELTMNIR